MEPPKSVQPTAAERWVRYFKINSGQPSFPWLESVDQALCFGWIDDLMRPAELQAFAARTENRSGIYSYEQRPAELPSS